jgi:hypothetical protein
MTEQQKKMANAAAFRMAHFSGLAKTPFHSLRPSARPVSHDQRDNERTEQGKEGDGDSYDGKENTRPTAISSDCADDAPDGNCDH